MGGSGTNAFSFLVSTLIDLYITAVLLRLLLQWVRADFYNPACQFLVKVTNPVLVPLRRLLPAVGKVDTGSVVLILLLEVARVWLIGLINGIAIEPQTLLLVGLMNLARTVLMTYLFLIFINVILSWLGQSLRNPVIPLVYQLTEPVLRPIRRVIPPIAGIDLSPLVALIAIRFLLHLLGW